VENKPPTAPGDGNSLPEFLEQLPKRLKRWIRARCILSLWALDAPPNQRAPQAHGLRQIGLRTQMPPNAASVRSSGFALFAQGLTMPLWVDFPARFAAPLALRLNFQKFCDEPLPLPFAA
jgi:hypothetical protein